MNYAAAGLPNQAIQSNNTATDGFECRTDENGEIVYQWVDTAIEHLSSSKLRQLIHLASIPAIEIDSEFITQVNTELQHRSQLTNQHLKQIKAPIH